MSEKSNTATAELAFKPVSSEIPGVYFGFKAIFKQLTVNPSGFEESLFVNHPYKHKS